MEMTLLQIFSDDNHSIARQDARKEETWAIV